MEFRILGPLRIGGPGGVIRIGAPKQRALLAALLLAHREDGVTTSRLIDMLWDAEPPPTAIKALATAALALPGGPPELRMTAAALADDPATGARLWGAADAMRAAYGGTRQPDEAAFAERVEGTLRDAVGPAAFTSAVAEGAALPQADAVALALEPKREIRGQTP